MSHPILPSAGHIRYDHVDPDLGFSYLSPEPDPLRVKLGPLEIGDGLPAMVIAEIGQNHNGDMDLAKRLIEMAARAGADAVKFQKRDIRSDLNGEAYVRPYVNPNSFGATYGEHREFLELDAAQHEELRDYAVEHGLMYFCTACDAQSVEEMERLGNPVYKVASRDLTNVPLLQVLAETGKPVILSTGMAGLDETREAIDALGDGPSAVLLMQCISQYPAELERVNLRAMKTLRNEFGLLVGLSDHTAGVIASVAASVLGACMVEKHVTLSRAMKGTDHAASLEEEGLYRVAKYIRETAVALGTGDKEIDPASATARDKLARSLTTRRALSAGTVLSEADLVVKSPGTGIAWRDRGRVIGRTLTVDVPADHLVTYEHVGLEAQPAQTHEV